MLLIVVPYDQESPEDDSEQEPYAHTNEIDPSRNTLFRLLNSITINNKSIILSTEKRSILFTSARSVCVQPNFSVNLKERRCDLRVLEQFRNRCINFFHVRLYLINGKVSFTPPTWI